MKHLLQILLLFCFPLLLMACEEGLFGEPVATPCLETRREDNTGLTVERIYNGNRIAEIRYYQDLVLSSYYAFSYGNDGRLSKSQYFNVAQNTESPPQQISYNDLGKWIKSTIPQSNGNVTTITIEYDNQNQIQELTSSTNRSGVDSVNYTYTYTWEAGNNTVRAYNSPTLNLVTHYEFDQNRENMRKKEQEKLAFLSTGFIHNKNMYRQSTFTVTTDSTTNETVSLYNFQYNEEGYPIQLTLTRTTNYGTPTVEESLFFYDCK